MAVVALSPVPVFKAFDNNGAPLAFGTLGSFIAGTSTPQATYQDSTGSTPNTNPIILNARGEANVWLTQSQIYKLVLKDTLGNIIWSVDNIPGGQALTQQIIGQLFYPQTTQETAAGVTPVNYFYPPGNVLRYGAKGDGATDNSSILNAINAIGISLFYPIGTYVTSSNVTQSVPLTFDFGAILKPGSGTTFTINAPLTAGPWQIFNTSSGGSIAGAIQPVNADGRMYFEWFGAKNNGTTDSTVAMQQTCLCAATAGYVGIQMLVGSYLISSTLNVNGNTTPSFKAPSIYGVDNKQSIIKTTTGNISLISYTGGSGQYCGAVVENVGFSGAGPTSGNNGIIVTAQCGLRFRRCYFANVQAGIEFNNATAGQFTEFDVADNCEFDFTCPTPLFYNVGSGTNSFHGSGLANKCVINSNTAGPFILIGAGARPYGAPLDLQCFFAANATLIGNNSTVPVDFNGTITTENTGGGTLTLATTNVVPFAGHITCADQTVLGGTLVRVLGLVTYASTVQAFAGGEKGYMTAMTTGANILASAFFNQHRLCYLRLLGTGYDYRYLVGVDPQGGGGAGVAATIAPYIGVGSPAPTFSVNTTGNLVVTNASFPAGTTCYWSEKVISFGNETLETVLF